MRMFKKALWNTCGAIGFFFAPQVFLSAQTIPITNAGFEESDGNNWAAGWTTIQHAGEVAYRFTLDSIRPFSGQSSARIEQFAQQEFGLFKQVIDARPLAGKRMKLSAQLRADKIQAGGAGLYLRVDGPGDVILGNDFTSGATAGTHGWKPFRAVIDIPAEAVRLEIGVMMQAFGVIWVDDIALATTTEPITKPAPVIAPSTITFDSPRSIDADPRRKQVKP
jgi:hypothetical protein